MEKEYKEWRGHRTHRFGFGLMCLASAILPGIISCPSTSKTQIAVIPATDGIPLWDSAHAGAEAAADRDGEDIYWNAPTREDDIERQITLVERAIRGGCQGLILAPDQSLALISPVLRATSLGIPTVIISSPLQIPPDSNLYYILNDDEMGGRLAAERVGKLLGGHGAIAILGLNPNIAGIMIRARALERSLAESYPGIQIVEKRTGSFNIPQEQQVAQDVIRAHPELRVIVSLMWSATDGAMSTLDSAAQSRNVKVIGFDAEFRPLFDQNTPLDSVIQEDTRSMGDSAVELIHARRAGQSVPALQRIPPILITSDNVDSAEVRRLFSRGWEFGNWHWSRIP